jgi:hypothetical protein
VEVAYTQLLVLVALVLLSYLYQHQDTQAQPQAAQQ